MDLLNRSLYSCLETKGFPSFKLSKQIMGKLLLGLRDIHSKGYIHRDLKLENIMILEKENELIDPVIIDLGLAEKDTN
jgi:serine/threonine protein kinase